MKMEHLVTAPDGGIVRETRARKGDTLYKDDAIVFLEPADVEPGGRCGRCGRRPRRHPPRPRRDVGATGFRPRREPARGRGQTAQDQPSDGARERRRALADPGSFLEYGSLAVAAQAARRSREDLIRNTPADGVVAGLATVNGDLFGAGTRPLHGRRLRLHRARRHAGRAQPQEAGPAVRPRRATAPADCALRRGRRRPAGRHRRARRDRPRRADLRAIRQAQRARAAGRHRLGPLLRRQRRAARLLRRDHRHQGFLDRHGRPGDDRGRRPGRRPPGRGRTGLGAGAERRHRHRGRGRDRGRRGGEDLSLLLPGLHDRVERAGPAAAARRDSREPAARL